MPSGSIPAPAGEPQQNRQSPALATVYPRACGGTVVGNVVNSTLKGLSPRLRGNQQVKGYCKIWGGSIPAPAGEPLCAAVERDRSSVYPRACGGTKLRYALFISSRGLSPRLRGNLCYPGHPARPLPVYPRACGGTMRRPLGLEVASPGLSPRLRGNQQPAGIGLEPTRSIPAPAGEPSPSKWRGPVGQVYPRACGGTAASAWGTRMTEGLSPRLRGNHPDITPALGHMGSIPAACGGTSNRAGDFPIEMGLSPRLRGNHPRLWQQPGR